MSIPEPILTPTYFAVQVHAWEKPHDIAKVILLAAHDQKLYFRRLESLDVMEVGVVKFQRFRTDLINIDNLLEGLFKAGRGVIRSVLGNGFEVRVGTRQGQVASAPMHMAPRDLKVFRGTKIKYWEQQFV